MLIGELTMTEYKAALKKTKTLIIPFGTVEAHGSHLPLNTDTLIIREVVKEAASKAAVFMSPPIQYGVCTSTGQHPGSIGITTKTLRLVTLDIVRDAYSKGLRNFILVSGHGGGAHIQALKDAGESLVCEYDDMKMAACCIYDIIGNETDGIIETMGDSHAGEMETSLVLHLAPRLVKGRAKEEYPSFPRPLIVRNKLKYWPGAVWGNPGKATVAKGERVFGIMVDALVRLVGQVESARL